MPMSIIKAIDASLVEMYSPEWAVVPEIGDESGRRLHPRARATRSDHRAAQGDDGRGGKSRLRARRRSARPDQKTRAPRFRDGSAAPSRAAVAPARLSPSAAIRRQEKDRRKNDGDKNPRPPRRRRSHRRRRRRDRARQANQTQAQSRTPRSKEKITLFKVKPFAGFTLPRGRGDPCTQCQDRKMARTTFRSHVLLFPPSLSPAPLVSIPSEAEGPRIFLDASRLTEPWIDWRVRRPSFRCLCHSERSEESRILFLPPKKSRPRMASN